MPLDYRRGKLCVGNPYHNKRVAEEVDKRDPMGATAPAQNTSPAPAARTTLSREQLERVFNACALASPQFGQAVGEFWGMDLSLQLFAISDKNLYFQRMDDYYVAQLSLSDTAPDKIAQLRISDAACAHLLGETLGPRDFDDDEFRFSRITPFEAHLLGYFSKHVFSHLLKTLVKQHASAKKKTQLVHLVWLVTTPGEADGPPRTMGKLALTLPLQAIRTGEEAVEGMKALPSHAGSREAVSDRFFFHTAAEAQLYIGRTRLPLEDIRNMEPGDVVVLEDSRTNRLALVDPASGDHLEFTPELRFRKKMELPYTQDIAMMEDQHLASVRDNLWDHLMIDVNAEFFPFRLPLHQLKQMSEGLIVEVGDLSQNKVRLHVEGKTLALGELVIVGDKFAIRVHEIDGKTDETASHADMTHAPQHMEQHAAPMASPELQQMMGHAEPGHDPAGPTDNVDAFLNDDFDDDGFEEDEW